MKHSKMMWACAAVIGLVLILAVAGVNVAVGLVAIPCVLMMGLMMWMMMRGMGSGGSHHSH